MHEYNIQRAKKGLYLKISSLSTLLRINFELSQVTMFGDLCFNFKENLVKKKEHMNKTVTTVKKQPKGTFFQ